jgi:hypothetical protein
LGVSTAEVSAAGDLLIASKPASNASAKLMFSDTGAAGSAVTVSLIFSVPYG